MTDNPLFLKELENVFNENFNSDIKALEGMKPHSFSERHNKKMNKLIKRQRKPYFKLISTAGRRAACVIVAVIVASASALSVKAIREAIFDFITNIFSDHSVVTTESGTEIGYPKIVENEYYISDLPDGFIIGDTIRNDVSINVSYFNDDKYILFSQYTKSVYEETLDNEHTRFEKINDETGQEYLMISTEADISFIWDNGRYIFEITSNLDKGTTLDLCKSTKMK